MKETSALVREASELPCPFHHMKTLGESAICEPQWSLLSDKEPVIALILDFPALELQETNFCGF
jgi:hypothetical protein